MLVSIAIFARKGVEYRLLTAPCGTRIACAPLANAGGASTIVLTRPAKQLYDRWRASSLGLEPHTTSERMGDRLRVSEDFDFGIWNLAKFVTVGEVWMISAGGAIAFVMACPQEVI